MEITIKQYAGPDWIQFRPLTKTKSMPAPEPGSHIPEWVENEQATAVLNVSKRTLQNWRDRGLLGFSKVGSKIYYSREEINRFLHRHAHPPFKN